MPLPINQQFRGDIPGPMTGSYVYFSGCKESLTNGAGVENAKFRFFPQNEVLIEWVYRILLSFLTLPSNWVKGRSQLRATLHALLIPVLLKPN